MSTEEVSTNEASGIETARPGIELAPDVAAELAESEIEMFKALMEARSINQGSIIPAKKAYADHFQNIESLIGHDRLKQLFPQAFVSAVSNQAIALSLRGHEYSPALRVIRGDEQEIGFGNGFAASMNNRCAYFIKPEYGGLFNPGYGNVNQYIIPPFGVLVANNSFYTGNNDTPLHIVTDLRSYAYKGEEGQTTYFTARQEISDTVVDIEYGCGSSGVSWVAFILGEDSINNNNDFKVTAYTVEKAKR